MRHAIVDTKTGKVRGINENGILIFKGIPYGAAPCGKRRFLPPLSPKPWTGGREAYEYGPSCPQAEYAGDLTIDSGNFQSEDCLFLNIWTPATGDDKKRPVMVWLHGGNFAFGSGSSLVVKGTNLAKRGDAVIITINHRLNVFGFLYLEEIAGETYAGSGNTGMLDIVLALQWVHDNIRKFGGDPDNVTIFGQSGGGRKVSVLLTMPSAKGLFHKAIIQSSPCLCGMTTTTATELAEQLLKQLNLNKNEIEKLHDIPFQQLLEAAITMPVRTNLRPEGAASGSLRSFTPVVDSRYLPANPFLPHASDFLNDVPIVIGTTRDEIALQAAYDPKCRILTYAELSGRLAARFGDNYKSILAVYQKTRPSATPWDLYIAILSEDRRLGCIILVESKMAAGNAPVFMYLFTWESDYKDYLFKACHTLEVPFVFDTADLMPITGNRPDKSNLVESVSGAWLSFANTGNPSHSGIPQWEQYTLDKRATMILDVPCRLEYAPARDELDAWHTMDIIP